ncbi:ADP-ribose pyrophosphatase [Lachnospiraceae bacterium TWA4]|nr:ADP-ribose pyrophosphatase [Lachnospiraceae bacterium TWA4]
MKNDKDLEWTPVSVEHVIQDKWIDFRKVKYRFPDGSEFEPYYQYSRRSYVVIVAQDEEGNYLCVRQFRHGIGKVTVEFPAGGIESEGATDYSSEGAREDAQEAAKRELREETGYISDEWNHLITIPSNPTVADNYAFVFYAKNCKKASDLELDDTEFLELELHTEEEIKQLIDDGKFAQAIHVMAWLMTKN